MGGLGEATGNLKEYFSQYGVVKRWLLAFLVGPIVANSVPTGQNWFPPWLLWVGFASEEGLQNTLQKDAHQLEGSKLEVQEQKTIRKYKQTWARRELNKKFYCMVD